MALLASSAKLSAARPSRRTAVVVRAADEVKVGINGAYDRSGLQGLCRIHDQDFRESDLDCLGRLQKL